METHSQTLGRARGTPAEEGKEELHKPEGSRTNMRTQATESMKQGSQVLTERKVTITSMGLS